MKTANQRLLAISVLALTSALTLIASLHIADAAPRDSTAARLQRLEDREQILELLTAYGTTLDRHDFAAFGRLFTEDAIYVSGPTPTQGRAAIQSILEKIIISNPSNLPPPNAHLFFNPSIHIEGDQAIVQSKGAYVAPDRNANVTQMVFFVWYEDILIRHEGQWLFQKRVVKNSASPSAVK